MRGCLGLRNLREALQDEDRREGSSHEIDRFTTRWRRCGLSGCGQIRTPRQGRIQTLLLIVLFLFPCVLSLRLLAQQGYSNARVFGSFRFYSSCLDRSAHLAIIFICRIKPADGSRDTGAGQSIPVRGGMLIQLNKAILAEPRKSTPGPGSSRILWRRGRCRKESERGGTAIFTGEPLSSR